MELLVARVRGRRSDSHHVPLYSKALPRVAAKPSVSAGASRASPFHLAVQAAFVFTQLITSAPPSSMCRRNGRKKRPAEREDNASEHEHADDLLQVQYGDRVGGLDCPQVGEHLGDTVSR